MEKSAGIIFIYQNEILLCHATNSPWNVWQPPKGHIEENEDELTAAIREVAEEVDIHIHPDLLRYKIEKGKDKVFTIDYTDKKGIVYKKVTYFTYHTNSLAEIGLNNIYIDSKNLQFAENDQARFFTYEELDTYCFWRLKSKLKELINEECMTLQL